MSGPGEGKIKIGKADVYIHLKGKSRASVTHIDIELDELNDIIKPGENSYVGGKGGGVFIGLKKARQISGIKFQKSRRNAYGNQKN